MAVTSGGAVSAVIAASTGAAMDRFRVRRGRAGGAGGSTAGVGAGTVSGGAAAVSPADSGSLGVAAFVRRLVVRRGARRARLGGTSSPAGETAGSAGGGAESTSAVADNSALPDRVSPSRRVPGSEPIDSAGASIASLILFTCSEF